MSFRFRKSWQIKKVNCDTRITMTVQYDLLSSRGKVSHDVRSHQSHWRVAHRWLFDLYLNCSSSQKRAGVPTCCQNSSPWSHVLLEALVRMTFCSISSDRFIEENWPRNSPAQTVTRSKWRGCVKIIFGFFSQ